MGHDFSLDVALTLSQINQSHTELPFRGNWAEKHPWNMPGPFYTGFADRSGNGPCLAPNNVTADAEGNDIIFRQPINHYELRQVIRAASADCFCSYGADGNDHWSPASVGDWWRQRRGMLEEIERMISEQGRFVPRNGIVHYSGLLRWRGYLRGEMEHDLRAYIFFLESGCR